MYVVGNADITGRVSDYMSLAAWFKLVETDDTDELEAFSVVDTLMVSISLILAFIQDQRKQQGVCWEEALLSNMVNTSLRQQQPLEPTDSRTMRLLLLGGAVEDEEGAGEEGERVGARDWLAFYQVCCKPLLRQAENHNIN